MLAQTTEHPDESAQADTEIDFDHTGFDLPLWREPLNDPRQPSLFPNHAGYAEAPDGDPVFALASLQTEVDDDHIQPHAPASFGA